MNTNVTQAPLEVKNESPSPTPMHWEPSPSTSQQSSAFKRKAQDDDENMAFRKLSKFKKIYDSCSSKPPMNKDSELPFSRMEIDDLEDFINLGEALDDANCHLYTNVDEFAQPLDVIELHYCILCKSHLGNYHNVLLSKFLFHLHCVLFHKFKCNFSNCSCFTLYKIETNKLHRMSCNFIQN